jgi:hypothetical protein
MSKYNLGIVKTSLLSNLNEATSIKQFIAILKESTYLKLENSIFDNIEKKHIPNEDLAIKYIDENVNLLKNAGCTKEIFEAEHKKFLPIMEGVNLNSTSKELYEQIHILLYESLSGKKPTNVNKLHDAFSYVLEHLKTNKKKQISESSNIPNIPNEIEHKEYIVKLAIKEFNERYLNLLSEDEIIVFKSLINENVDLRKESFITLKESTLSAVNKLKSELESQDTTNISLEEKKDILHFIGQLNESIKNIQNLQFEESTFKTKILDIVALKKDLSN